MEEKSKKVSDSGGIFRVDTSRGVAESMLGYKGVFFKLSMSLGYFENTDLVKLSYKISLDLFGEDLGYQGVYKYFKDLGLDVEILDHDGWSRIDNIEQANRYLLKFAENYADYTVGLDGCESEEVKSNYVHTDFSKEVKVHNKKITIGDNVYEIPVVDPDCEKLNDFIAHAQGLADKEAEVMRKELEAQSIVDTEVKGFERITSLLEVDKLRSEAAVKTSVGIGWLLGIYLINFIVFTMIYPSDCGFLIGTGVYFIVAMYITVKAFMRLRKIRKQWEQKQ